MRLSYRFQLAHHPLCDRYSDQRFEVGGVHLCQGCTYVTGGSLLGVITGLTFSLVYFVVPWYVAYTIFFISLVPAFLIDRSSAGRVAKRFARFSMGMGLGFAVFLVASTHSWLLRFLYLLTIVVLYRLYRHYRTRHPPRDLCVGCEYSEEKPYCPGLITQMEANKQYMNLATDLLQPDIQRRIEKIRSTEQSGQHEP